MDSHDLGPDTSNASERGLWSVCIPALLVFCEFIIKPCAKNGKFKKV